MSWRAMLGADPFAGMPTNDPGFDPGVDGGRADGWQARRSHERGARTVLLAVVALVVSVVVVLTLTHLAGRRAAARHPVTVSVLAQAQAQLAGLTRDSREPAAPVARYDRKAFGQAWADVDGNGCDTRNDVLARDLHTITVEPGTGGCVVTSGVLEDPYTGRSLRFQRGPRSADVQIDHVVALADAWRSGASRWEAGRRRALANDPANLLAVDGATNQDKSASDASVWLPPDRGFACVYVVKQIEVKAAYALSVTSPEGAAMARELERCAVVPDAAGAPGRTGALGRTAALGDPESSGAAGSGGATTARRAGSAVGASRRRGVRPAGPRGRRRRARAR